MVNLFLTLICVILAMLFGKMIYVEVPIKPKVLARTGGAIDKDNFSYFYVHSHGPIILNLTSLIGDADMYISDTNMYPTYNSESYMLHSATCGEDVIEVPETFDSPLAVGIYGHAESSFFILEIYENPNSQYPYRQWVVVEKEISNLKETNKQESKTTANQPNIDQKRGTSNQVLKKKKNRTSSSIPSIFSVLEILQLIFL